MRQFEILPPDVLCADLVDNSFKVLWHNTIQEANNTSLFITDRLNHGGRIILCCRLFDTLKKYRPLLLTNDPALHSKTKLVPSIASSSLWSHHLSALCVFVLVVLHRVCVSDLYLRCVFLLVVLHLVCVCFVAFCCMNSFATNAAKYIHRISIHMAMHASCFFSDSISKNEPHIVNSASKYFNSE